MAHSHDAENALVVHVKAQDGRVIAVFQCLDDKELDKLNNSENLKPPVFINVRHLRLFLGNAIVVSEEDEWFVGESEEK